MKNKMLSTILSHFTQIADPNRAKTSLRFVKTGPGEYGEGDKFFGISNPVLRNLVKEYQHASYEDCIGLLNSDYHEARMFGLLLLVRKFERGCEAQRSKIIDLYLTYTHRINSWDLVDCSCYKMLGRHLYLKDHSILTDLANSSLIWERRIAMVSTLYFIKKGQFDTTFKLAIMLLEDEQDLIHKAVGWMLKEVGNKDMFALKQFLAKYYQHLPRTALRYSIEKMPKSERAQYLTGQL